MKKIDVPERNALLKEPYKEKNKEMDRVILVKYETTQSFQASWIEQRTGSIFYSFAS